MENFENFHQLDEDHAYEEVASGSYEASTLQQGAVNNLFQVPNFQAPTPNIVPRTSLP